MNIDKFSFIVPCFRLFITGFLFFTVHVDPFIEFDFISLRIVLSLTSSETSVLI